MSGAATPGDVERFREIVKARLGLAFDDAKLGFLGEVLQRRLAASGRRAAEYLGALDNRPSPGELGLLASELTVTETYFFRNIEQFRALRDVVFPERMRHREPSRMLRLLSAACASGEEAYTLAIVAGEVVPDPSWAVSIRAVDVNPRALEKAGRARYAPWALRETPHDVQRRWFRQDDREMVLSDAVRSAVTFESRNLAADDADLWQPETYDVVFCRNAIMYFTPDQASALVARIARALAPGGYLFLGHAETLRGLSDDFHLRHSHDTFYYQRKEGLDRRIAVAGTDPRHQAAARPFAPAMPLSAMDDAWMDTIRRASERIEALVAPPALAARPPGPDRVEPGRRGRDLSGVLDLLRSERFADALAHLRGLPPDADDDADVLLLKAMLIAHGGEFAAAAETCERLIELDELNAGAHYVLALCSEGLGDHAGAIERDRVAIYLDAAFAMPRLHIGLLARRTGDRDLARRELAQALALLKHEDTSRLLLFGGGFDRQALLNMCSTALRDCGGRP